VQQITAEHNGTYYVMTRCRGHGTHRRTQPQRLQRCYLTSLTYKVTGFTAWLFYLWLDVTAPTAAAGADQTVDEGDLVSSTVSGSTDNVAVTNWTWSFTYNSSAILLYGETANYTFDIDGVYTVLLTVSDEMATRTTTA